ncbi:MAG: cytochrome b [Proteobacteria bacterium]|nr:cytochrome b [Pseudomonadota bacterium]MBS0462227.1 cytochrome b [Pseudomonadota bacterium]MBS0464150.1 cytochrome b [Pseudomonadota bacterium]
MADPTRYSPGLRRLHWWMALLIVAVYIAMEQRGIFPRGSAGRAGMMQAHYWLGLLVFALVWWRLALRRSHGAPGITPPLPMWQAIPAKLLHLALYAFFIVMPLLGLATAWTDGKQVLIPFTQIAIPPLLAENEDLAHRLEDVHVTIGEVFYWVIGLHVVAALYHHFFRRDDTLRRML